MCSGTKFQCVRSVKPARNEPEGDSSVAVVAVLVMGYEVGGVPPDCGVFAMNEVSAPANSLIGGVVEVIAACFCFWRSERCISFCKYLCHNLPCMLGLPLVGSGSSERGSRGMKE